MAASELRRAHEIVKDRLYYVALRSRPRDTAHEHFFSVDSALVYWNFFLDFGPLNFAQVCLALCDCVCMLCRTSCGPEMAVGFVCKLSGMHSQALSDEFLSCPTCGPMKSS